MARPLTVLIHRITTGVNRARSTEVATTSTHHHAAEPSSTPRTTTAGRRNDPPVPSPSVAASAANDTMVAGFVMVRPRVET